MAGFLEDFAFALSRIDPQLHECLHLTAVEGSAAGRRAIAARGIEPEPRILESAAELGEGSVEGWIFSNELYDALPVVRVQGTDAGLAELRVGANGGRFTWTAAPAPRELLEHLAQFGVVLEPGQKAEIARMPRRSIARSPGRFPGVRSSRSTTVTRRVSSITRSRAPRERSRCTWAGAAAATRSSARARGPDGARELALLLSAGEAEGLRAERLMRQGMFLTEIGILDFAGSDAEKWRIFRLIDPEGMGEELSVLVQRKGVAPGGARD